MRQLTVAVSHSQGTTVLGLAGELDFASAPDLRGHLIDACAGPPATVVVDCAALQFIDSSGIGLLVAAHRRLVEAGSQLILANVDESVGKTLRLAQVDEFLPIHWLEGQPSTNVSGTSSP